MGTENKRRIVLTRSFSDYNSILKKVTTTIYFVSDTDETVDDFKVNLYYGILHINDFLSMDFTAIDSNNTYVLHKADIELLGRERFEANLPLLFVKIAEATVEQG